MKPRNLIKTGIVLAELLILGWIVTFAVDFFSGGITGQAAVGRAADMDSEVELVFSPQMDETPEPPAAADQAAEAEVPAAEDAAAPIMAPAAEAVDCGPPADWVIYQVEEGDTLESLVLVYSGVDVDLAQANCLGEEGVVMAGMNIFVPPFQPRASVVRGQTSSEPQESAQAATSMPTEAAAPPSVENTPEVVVTPPAQVTQEAGNDQTQEPIPTTEADEVVLDLASAVVATPEGYVSNPGMGWQYRGGTFPLTYPAETVSYSKRNQISWMILNPSEGVYNWGPLDSQLSTAVSQGKQFSFRVYTMIGETFGGQQVPQWVLDKGAVLTATGEPNYANCTYQQEWGKFVNALRQRYDGNSNIAFIDISGYGNFNEWSWQDQTEWDDVWADAYANGTAGPDTMSTMDSYARRVLADMFIGGSFNGHQCVDANNVVQTYDYNYPGFKSTQLVMPYAGVIQSTQYVYTKTRQVGFRYDCLGRESGNAIVDRLGKELAGIWPHAPVIFETCKPYEFTTANALYLIQNTHPILVHDVNLDLTGDAILPLLEPLGYKYTLNSLQYSTRVRVGDPLHIIMEWQNDGISPSYPKMGQRFELHVYLVDADGQRVADLKLPADISSWMPATQYNGTPPVYTVDVEPVIPQNVAPGVYRLDYAIVDTRTGQEIWVPEKLIPTVKVAGIIVMD